MKSSGFGHSLEFIILLERPPWQGAVPFVMLAILHGGVWLYLWWGMALFVVGDAAPRGGKCAVIRGWVFYP